MRSVLERLDDSRKVEFTAGSVLLSEGERSGKLYVLAEGTVEVARGDTPVAVVNEAGSVFGEMSVLLDVPHTATVKALSAAKVYVFDDAAAFMKSDPEIALVVARLLAQRLNTATTYLVDLKRQYAGQKNHLGMVSEVLASLLNQPETDFRPGSDRQPDPSI
ncbi:cyclic nucleotide-binding domain-containing protein [Mesorhizobium sp. VNQ89]|uniref:Crp/Fnr family transcriptional regulator n=1 Tax=Mesorhizobium quangtriensis TaxID=3157709 RepID=UPI0032B84AE5